MTYWVIKKYRSKNDLDRLIAGETDWKIDKERFRKGGFRNPKNIGSLEPGDRFVIYYVEKKTRLFCAQGIFNSKRHVGNRYELTFHNRAGERGFDEFPNKVDYNSIKSRINWKPIESSIRFLEKEDYRVIMSMSGLAYQVAEHDEVKNENAKGKDSGPISIPTIETIAENSLWAMKQVKKYERMHGRKPKDVSDKAVGFDIESTDKSGRIRYIEVKSRKGNTSVALTDNEFKTANRFREKYFLYVLTEDSIYIVKDPVRNCSPEKRFTVAWYLRDWYTRARKENMPLNKYH